MHMRRKAEVQEKLVADSISDRRTIGSSDNPALLGGVRAKNNGRYNGNGRHWETPPEIFVPLHKEFDFTLDPCATEETAKCTLFFTEEQNGLNKSWKCHRVFMNPPYGREVYAWVEKARLEAERGALVVGLLPASTDLAWWHDHVWGRAEIRYLRGRVRFLTGGPYRASGFFASIIAVWRPFGAHTSHPVTSQNRTGLPESPNIKPE
jgi:phage N-6-adenine-methyltransferase